MRGCFDYFAIDFGKSSFNLYHNKKIIIIIIIK